jgi:endonuclease YncB( thermonuclease family)
VTRSRALATLAVGVVLLASACSAPARVPPPVSVPTSTSAATSFTTTPEQTVQSSRASVPVATSSHAATTSPAATSEASQASSQASSANPPPLTGADVTNLTGKVLSVYDGDTFTVELNGEKEHVRPLGIDAPELENKGIGVKGECYGKESGDALRALLTGTTVRLAIDPEQGDPKADYRDKYGRLLRYVTVPLDTGDIATAQSTTDLGDYQLTHGNAWVYEQYPVERTPDYMTEMQQAQQEHAGLWAACE